LAKLTEERDPIVANHYRNGAAREVSYLLPDEICKMKANDWKDLKDEVRTLIAASEETLDLK
jgi:hypothetical protein